MKTKKCYSCQKILPISDFTKNKNTKDNLSYYCRDCSKKKYSLYRYKHDSKENYDTVVIDELRKNNIPIEGLDIDKMKNLCIHMSDLPGVIKPLLKELPGFCKKYNLTYEEYNFFIDLCHNNKIWIKSRGK